MSVNHRRIDVVGWDAASDIISRLVQSGYQVLVQTDEEHTGLPLDKVAIIIEYVQPSWDGCEYVYHDPEKNETDK